MEQEDANGTAATSGGDELFAEVNLLSPTPDHAPSSKPEDEMTLEFFDQKEATGGLGKACSDDQEPALLQSLEDSTSSSDIPKSKLAATGGGGGAEPSTIDNYISAKRERGGGEGVGELSQDMDLKVSITERAKHGTKSDTYITYKVITDSTRPSHLFGSSHYEAWRRYRDFEWLRLQLEKHHPTLIVPPLPGKQLARYFDQMGDQFLNERQKALQKFLHRLTAHPYFSFSSTLKVFLTANPEELAKHMSDTSSGYKLLGVMTSSMKQATTSFMLKNADPEFAKESKYFSELGDKLGVMEKVSTRVHSERGELSVAEDDFSLSLFHWASLEPQLTHPLQKIAGCVDQCNAAERKLNDANAFSLLMTLKEYQLYCASAVSAIRRRDMLQLESERASDDRVKKKKTHDQAVTAGKVEKVVKLADDLEKVGLAAEQALDNMSQANEQLRVDIEKWKEAKNKDVSQLMHSVSSDHIDYHQKCFSEWETVLRILKNIKPSATAAPPTTATASSSSSTLQSSSLPEEEEEPSPLLGKNSEQRETESSSQNPFSDRGDEEGGQKDGEDGEEPFTAAGGGSQDTGGGTGQHDGLFGEENGVGEKGRGLFEEEDTGLFGGGAGGDGTPREDD